MTSAQHGAHAQGRRTEDPDHPAYPGDQSTHPVVMRLKEEEKYFDDWAAVLF